MGNLDVQPITTGPATSVRRVLILEDEAMVGVLIESIIRVDGGQALLTAHPDQFFAALPDWSPTHIVLDLTLPGMNGEAVLQRLAATDEGPGCQARIVLTSGVDSERLQAAQVLGQGLGLRMAGVLAKPFLPAALRAVLR